MNGAAGTYRLTLPIGTLQYMQMSVQTDTAGFLSDSSLYVNPDWSIGTQYQSLSPALDSDRGGVDFVPARTKTLSGQFVSIEGDPARFDEAVSCTAHLHTAMNQVSYYYDIAISTDGSWIISLPEGGYIQADQYYATGISVCATSDNGSSYQGNCVIRGTDLTGPWTYRIAVPKEEAVYQLRLYKSIFYSAKDTNVMAVDQTSPTTVTVSGGDAQGPDFALTKIGAQVKVNVSLPEGMRYMSLNIGCALDESQTFNYSYVYLSESRPSDTANLVIPESASSYRIRYYFGYNMDTLYETGYLTQNGEVSAMEQNAGEFLVSDGDRAFTLVPITKDEAEVETEETSIFQSEHGISGPGTWTYTYTYPVKCSSLSFQFSPFTDCTVDINGNSYTYQSWDNTYRISDTDTVTFTLTLSESSEVCYGFAVIKVTAAPAVQEDMESGAVAVYTAGGNTDEDLLRSVRSGQTIRASFVTKDDVETAVALAAVYDANGKQLGTRAVRLQRSGTGSWKPAAFEFDALQGAATLKILLLDGEWTPLMVALPYQNAT